MVPTQSPLIDDPESVVLIVNPESGTGDHVDAVQDRATVLGYGLRRTQRRGHGIELTEEAIAAGAGTVVAVGGDGTLNEVVRGVYAADALDDVTVGVIPAGTGNDFAGNLGITDLDGAFTALREGDRRHLDLGLANGTAFVNSCIAGVTAEASGETTPEMKSRYGVIAYVLTSLRVVSEFQGLDLEATLTADGADETVWSGSASMVLVGNGRRFTVTGGAQADVEDGLLDVTIVEDAGTLDLVGDGTRERLFSDGGEHLTRVLVSSLELSVTGDEAATFSLDGEMEDFEAVTFEVRPGALTMPVGDGYEPHPEGGDPA